MMITRTILTTVLMLLLAPSVFATGIDFFHGSWEEAKAKAKVENKLIFVDAYTTWCGPCKRMTANIFPDEAVGEFYNANFIAVKLDMEKEGDGLNFAKTYAVKNYPTLLYIDGDGKLMHRGVGYKDAEALVALGKTALDPDARFANMAQQYKKGNREPEIIRAYLMALVEAHMDYKEVADWYFYTQSEDGLLTLDNFEIISKVVSDVNHPIFKFVFNNRTIYRERAGAEKVNEYLSSTLGDHMMQDLKSEDAFSKAVEELRSSGYIEAEKVISQATAFFAYYYKKDYKAFVKAATKFLRQYAWDNADYLGVYSFMTYGIPESIDQESIKEAINWSLRAIALDNNAINNYTYAAMLYKAGKTKSALKVANKALKMAAQEGDNDKYIMILIDKIKAED